VIKPRKNKDIQGKTKICKIKLKCSWFATAVQFYYNAGLCKAGQHRAKYGGKPWNYYGLDY